MSFGVPLMLLGLAALAIPVVIHLLNRRRFQVVEWGAMQFLKVSDTTRRRLLIEELLLMALRMGLIALAVLALAGPQVRGGLFGRLGPRPNREIVLVFDGSDSMNRVEAGRSLHEAAKEWATAWVGDLAPGDSVAVIQARQQAVAVLDEPTPDLERVRQAIHDLPAPRGGCDWPQAVQAATRILTRKGRHPQRDIILLGDGQRHGWADEASLLRWELLAHQLRGAAPSEVKPRVWTVNVNPDADPDPPSWALEPLRVSRAVASVGQPITFRTGLVLRGQPGEYQPPAQLLLEVNDGRQVQRHDLRPFLKTPTREQLRNGRLPLEPFPHRFTRPGSYLVSVIVEPAPERDRLPGDNRQDLAIEVLPALPVLLIDGDPQSNPRTRGSDFLRDALAPARDPTPAVLARVVPVSRFEPDLLTRDLGPPGSRPRVLVLCNVARLTAEQRDAVTRFLAEGGGVLVTLGDRVDARSYNEHLHRGGQGWLPARLDGPQGDETDPKRAVSPLPKTFSHPALELFREVTFGGLDEARFPRWWKLSTPGRGSASVPGALFTNDDPFLVEHPYQAGKAVVCAVPLDNSWRTNLVELPAFAPLAHELVFHLAGARSGSFNLPPGQPLRYRPPGDRPPRGPLKLQPPEGKEVALKAERWPLVHEHTRVPGVYRLTTEDEGTVFFVVPPDPRESDLTPCEPADRERVSKIVPMTYENDHGRMVSLASASGQPQPFWWWFMVGVVGLLCLEVWMTRRLVRNR